MGFSLQDINIPGLGKKLAVVSLSCCLDDDTMAGGHFSWLFALFTTLRATFFMKITCLVMFRLLKFLVFINYTFYHAPYIKGRNRL